MWVDDGSTAVRTGGASASEFWVEGKKPGDSPLNARFSKALESGAYFEVTALELKSHFKVGVATEEGFKEGYALKGLFFNGNLSNGSALVLSSFGPKPAKGQRLGVLVEYEGDSITVIFYQDGRCLGPGFVAKRNNPTAPVFPVVSTSDDGDRFAISFPAAPVERTRQPKAPAGPGTHSAVGKWELARLSVGPELGEVPLAELLTDMMGGKEVVTLEVSPSATPGSFDLALKVANVLRTTVTAKADAALAPFEAVTVGPVMSTKMMPLGSIATVEKHVSDGLPGLRKWIVSEHGLILSGPTFEAEFRALAEGSGPGPATDTPLP